MHPKWTLDPVKAELTSLSPKFRFHQMAICRIHRKGNHFYGDLFTDVIQFHWMGSADLDDGNKFRQDMWAALLW